MELAISSGVIIVGALLVVLLLIAIAISRLIVHVPPNMVAVFTGRGPRPKTVVGGMKIRVPLLEQVRTMSLEPFDVKVQVEGALSSNGVPVNVEAVAVIRISSEEADLQTAIERYLTTDRSVLDKQNREILTGCLREVIATMTVEELNANRDRLTAGTASSAESSFGKLGMSLEVLTIQAISDDNGYLNALGRKQIAEVNRDARIGEADATRQAQVAEAEARQEGATADAKADSAIDEANRSRDLRRATIAGEVEAEEARAKQAGLLATAEASKAVGIADEEARAAREQAAVDVERQRALRATEAQRAEVIVPAQAQREAADLIAEAERVKTVTAAAAAAEATRSTSVADAESRTALSAATRAELEAAAAGHAAELQAAADGERAMLLARADGERQLAEAFNAYGEGAAQLYILPDLIRRLPEIAEQLAAPIGDIDRLVLIGGSGSGNGTEGDGLPMLHQLAQTVPMGMAMLREVVNSTTGIDLGELVKGSSIESVDSNITDTKTDPVTPPVENDEHSVLE